MACIVGSSCGTGDPGSPAVEHTDVDLGKGNTCEIPITVKSVDAVQVCAAVEDERDQSINSCPARGFPRTPSCTSGRSRTTTETRS